MKTFWRRTGCRIIILGLIWTGGCGHEQKAPPEAPLPAPPPYFDHTVRWPGENLIRIAWWYTGSGNNWKYIAEANPSLEPRRMQIGDSIQIPVGLLKTRVPMPKSYRIPVARKRKPQSAPVASPLLPDEDIELFGPVDSEARDNTPEEIYTPAEPGTGSHQSRIQVPDDPQSSPDEEHDNHDGENPGQEI